MILATQRVLRMAMNLDWNKEYTELIVVEGLDNELVGVLHVGDFELVDLYSRDYEEWVYVQGWNVIQKVRQTMNMNQPVSLLCFIRRWNKEYNGSDKDICINKILDYDCRCLDVTLMLSSTKDTDAKVILGIFFDSDRIDASKLCGVTFLPIYSQKWEKLLTIDSGDICLVGEIYSCVCDIIKKSEDSKTNNYLFQVYGSKYGAPNQRFISMVVAFDMLREDTSGQNSRRIEIIVDHFFENESAEGKIKALYNARTKYIHQGDSGGIGKLFDYTYDLMIRLTRQIILNGLDVGGLEKICKAESEEKRRVLAM